MAEKRMFSRAIVRSDAFCSMSQGAQLLYYHAAMDADDDGAIGAMRVAMADAGATQADLDELLASKFILRVGRVYVVKHWKLMNKLRTDRYHISTWSDELSLLEVKEDGSYRLIDDADATRSAVVTPLTSCGGDTVDTQCDTGGDSVRWQQSIVKDSLDKPSIVKTRKARPESVDAVREYCTEKGYHFDPEAFWYHYQTNGWVQGKGKPIKDWKACCVTWEKTWKEKRQPETTAQQAEADRLYDKYGEVFRGEDW